MDNIQISKIYIKQKNFFFIMEEIEQGNENNIELQNRKTSINASEIVKKFRTIKDRQLFCREMSILIFYNFRSIFPPRNWI